MNQVKLFLCSSILLGYTLAANATMPGIATVALFSLKDCLYSAKLNSFQSKRIYNNAPAVPVTTWSGGDLSCSLSGGNLLLSQHLSRDMKLCIGHELIHDGVLGASVYIAPKLLSANTTTTCYAEDFEGNGMKWRLPKVNMCVNFAATAFSCGNDYISKEIKSAILALI